MNHVVEGSILRIFFYFYTNEFLAASMQREPQGRNPSTPPAPTRPHPAAPIVRVACGCPYS